MRCELMGTLGCHLCEQAEQILLPFLSEGVVVELIDIAESEALVGEFGLRIPVLRRLDTGAELDWPFEARQVSAFLELGECTSARPSAQQCNRAVSE